MMVTGKQTNDRAGVQVAAGGSLKKTLRVNAAFYIGIGLALIASAVIAYLVQAGFLPGFPKPDPVTIAAGMLAGTGLGGMFLYLNSKQVDRDNRFIEEMERSVRSVDQMHKDALELASLTDAIDPAKADLARANIGIEDLVRRANAFRQTNDTTDVLRGVVATGPGFHFDEEGGYFLVHDNQNHDPSAVKLTAELRRVAETMLRAGHQIFSASRGEIIFVPSRTALTHRKD